MWVGHGLMDIYRIRTSEVHFTHSTRHIRRRKASEDLGDTLKTYQSQVHTNSNTQEHHQPVSKIQPESSKVNHNYYFDNDSKSTKHTQDEV